MCIGDGCDVTAHTVENMVPLSLFTIRVQTLCVLISRSFPLPNALNMHVFARFVCSCSPVFCLDLALAHLSIVVWPLSVILAGHEARRSAI